MPTYRCRSCGGLYVDPQPDGTRHFHACTAKVRDQLGNLVDTPSPRDENIVQETVVGKLPDGPQPDLDDIIVTRMRRHGAGRVKLNDGDVLTGVDVAAIAALQAMAGVPVPDL